MKSLVILLFSVSRIPLFCTPAQAGRIVWPCTCQITSPYGPRTCSSCSSNFHYGIDIGVGLGTILGAPGHGTVASYSFNNCGGNVYRINYGNGWDTRFMHCSSAIVPAGRAVTRNTYIPPAGDHHPLVWLYR